MFTEAFDLCQCFTSYIYFESHIQMKMEKLPMPDFCPLKVILDPVEENSQHLELLDTEEGIFVFENEMFPLILGLLCKFCVHGACQLDIFWHNRLVSSKRPSRQASLASLESSDSCTLKHRSVLKSQQMLAGEPVNQTFTRLLIASDFRECHCTTT